MKISLKSNKNSGTSQKPIKLVFANKRIGKTKVNRLQKQKPLPKAFAQKLNHNFELLPTEEDGDNVEIIEEYDKSKLKKKKPLKKLKVINCDRNEKWKEKLLSEIPGFNIEEKEEKEKKEEMDSKMDIEEDRSDSTNHTSHAVSSLSNSLYFKDINSRPDAPSFDVYQQVPVEDFGKALLRGLGWKGDKENSNSEDKENSSSMFLKNIETASRRSIFLGLGAKPSSSNKGKEKEKE
ncbi:spliceosome ATPase-activating subunit SPP2 ASCRUDRAFT_115638 [Ascoidea rubescens DSM 1968]|uniref:Pre-mRNA-splicing factor n=1 Tax=Ascoidea rubescens DSM 1968 TaxID=1344418 RepID=A0A1D2VBV0_9ASCO|nr:hypothetical protein ASCRUDRAFT_115638 [Ascoidea rubescens DSM 1968]ODV59032.1 hypothetical protein ASCRUDRAFT_115638 [Ascoidea rubescens DSM 1968]